MTIRSAALSLWASRLELRSRLSAQDRAIIAALPGRVERFGSSQDVVALGSRTTHSCLVAEGLVARFGQTESGARQFTAFYLPGDMGDLHSAVLPRVTAPLQSALHATIVFVPHADILNALEQSPALARAFWRDCVVDAQVSSQWMLNLGRRTAQARVAHLLCEMARRYQRIGGSVTGFPLDFTQGHLADATGLTNVHVNRSLRTLRESGAVEVRDRRVSVLDWALLAQLGEFDEEYLYLRPEERDGNENPHPIRAAVDAV
jgi:CRP-like cAMP-binding protein